MATPLLPKSNKRGKELGNYLIKRPSLAGVVLLIDIRRGITKHDIGLLIDCPAKRPVLILLTKADKLPYGQRQKVIAKLRKDVANQLGHVRPLPFCYQSSRSRRANEKILNWISPQVVPSNLSTLTIANASYSDLTRTV